MSASWADILVGSFQNIWFGFINFLPTLLGALILFLVGLIIANGLGLLVNRIIAAIKLDRLLEKIGVKNFCERAGWGLNSAKFFGELVKWFFIIVFLMAAVDILKLYALSNFLRDVIFYIPRIVGAILIMLATVVIGNFLRGLVKGSVKGAKMYWAKLLSSITWWAVLIFGLLTALLQLGVAVSIINTLITGFIAMLAIAGGIAFGLGGKDYASYLIEKFREKIEE